LGPSKPHRADGAWFTVLTCGACVSIHSERTEFVYLRLFRSYAFFAFKFVHQTPPQKTQKRKTNPSYARREPNGVVITGASGDRPFAGLVKRLLSRYPALQ
jgi:hypothetical protein